MVEDFRFALLVTLTVLVLFLLFRRFKRYYRIHHMPVPQHVELKHVEVMYHPSILRVQVNMPRPEEVFPAMLTQSHAPLRSWPAVRMEQGDHVLELPLEANTEGIFFFEIATATQRTERRFTVRQV